MGLDKETWISAQAAGKILGISLDTVKPVAERAGVRRKELPGLHPRYSREDVERLAESCIKVGPDDGPQGRKERGDGPAGKHVPTPRPGRQRA